MNTTASFQSSRALAKNTRTIELVLDLSPPWLHRGAARVVPGARRPGGSGARAAGGRLVPRACKDILREKLPVAGGLVSDDQSGWPAGLDSPGRFQSIGGVSIPREAW